jgi:TfoX/Sxy family transcriptional regulator of competence genes
MAYDEGLAHRVRGLMAGEPGLVEKKMFGGLGLMLDGNMACGVMGDEVLIRLDPATQEQALAEPGTRPFAMTSRPSKGWILVAGDACTEDDLRRWVDRGISYARSLPPK